MSYWSLHYHLVWATKYRACLLDDQVESLLYPFLIQKCCEFETQVFALNGYQNHVHLVASIPPKFSISEVIGTLKGSSSYYLNQIMSVEVEIRWQRGFSVFSFGAGQLKYVVTYVENQKIHHQKSTTVNWLEKFD
ncbi:MAG: IS200/IS605 family transposase [Ardenticatenaceae bacterium]|nr:IS200/IS605 family transposase [Ardenticatenaceae bacterium]